MSLRLGGSWRVEFGTQWLELGFGLPHSLLHDIVMLIGHWTLNGMRFLGACITLDFGLRCSLGISAMLVLVRHVVCSAEGV